MRKGWWIWGLFWISSVAWSLGLGPIHLRSALDEPLDADIELLARSPGELENLTIGLAPEGAYARRGLERPFFLEDLRFSLERGPGGRPYIHVTSRRPIHEPFVDLLVEIRGPQGRILRRYTLLLDPREPGRRPAAPALPQPVPQPPGEAEAPAAYGPVRRGETLWGIAQRLRPDPSVSPQRMMVALFKENPDAFIGGDINKLKAGAVLRVPDLEAVRSIPRQEVLQTLQGPETAPPKGRLKLVTPEEKAPQDELALLREELSSKEQENQALKGKVQELEAMVASMQRLIAIKDRELAQLKADIQKLQETLSAPPKEPPPPEPVKETPPAEVQPPKEPVPEEQPSTPPVVVKESQAGKALWLQLSSLTLLLAALVILILVTAWWLYRQRRASAMATPVPSQETTPPPEVEGGAPVQPAFKQQPTPEPQRAPEQPLSDFEWKPEEEVREPEVREPEKPPVEPLSELEWKPEEEAREPEPLPDLGWEPEEAARKEEAFPDLQWTPEETKLEGLLAESPPSEEEAIDVRLELAKTYLDLGDREEARKLLEEVLEEGSEEQKRKARELLNQAA